MGDDIAMTAIPVDLPKGISDLTVDDQDHLWAIAERDPFVAEIELSKSNSVVGIREHALDNVPNDIDTEALAYLGDGRFAIGYEGHTLATAGVMLGQLGPAGEIRLSTSVPLSQEQIGIELRVNNGVEALCRIGTQLIVGIESTGRTADGTRYAPLVHVDGALPYAVQRLRLTTENGKLSALSCRTLSDGRIELLAIERDFGVLRLLRARMRGDEREVQPEVALDLWPVARDRYNAKLNLEGITRLRDGRVVMVNDNQGRGLDGPSWLFVLSDDELRRHVRDW